MTLSTPKIIICRISLLLLTVSLFSCETKNDPDLVPSYLHIEKIDVSANSQQGTSSSKITDAWVYINDNLIGSYELPATIPILTEGKQHVVVKAGIKINGINNTRNTYPFYTDITQDINFVRDSVVNLTSTTVTYRTNTLFAWMENFDQPGLSLDTTSKSDVSIDKTNDPDKIFSETGNSYSGIVQLTADSTVFEAVTSEKFEFPSAGNSVFLEMNYKINHKLVVGVFYLSSGIRYQRPLIVLNESDDWKKVYINLTVPKYDTPNATDFQIFFGAQKEDGTDDALFLIDNLKLVHFNIAK